MAGLSWLFNFKLKEGEIEARCIYIIHTYMYTTKKQLWQSLTLTSHDIQYRCTYKISLTNNNVRYYHHIYVYRTVHFHYKIFSYTIQVKSVY